MLMRKQPQQPRSRALVESLVIATAETISREGLEAATAARVAKRAGVGIGSLYQYFNNKTELYDEVLARLTQALEQLVDDNLQMLDEHTLGEFTASLLHDVWDFLEADEGLYLGVVKHWAQLDFLRFLNSLEQRMAMNIGLVLMSSNKLRSSSELSTQTFILINSVLFTTVRYISSPPRHISKEQLIAQFSSLADNMMQPSQDTLAS